MEHFSLVVPGTSQGTCKGSCGHLAEIDIVMQDSRRLST